MRDMSPATLAPTPALVRPRAYAPDSGEILPLETLAAELLERPSCRRIEISGGPGSGKSTALRHLAATLPATSNAVFLDEPTLGEVQVQSQHQRVFYSGRKPQAADVVLQLAPWTDDDLIELLLAVAPQRCGEALRRIQAAPDRAELQGNPALWRMALDQWLGDAELTTMRAAVVQALTKLCATLRERRLAAEFCLAILLKNDQESLRLIGLLCPNLAQFGRFGPLRHPFVQRLLAGQKVATLIRSGGACPALQQSLPPSLVEELAIWARTDAALAGKLREIVAGPRRSDHAQAATILFAADPQWRPAEGKLATLGGGSFPRAGWAGLKLPSTDKATSSLSRANLTAADLSQASLDGANCCDVWLTGARLDKASLQQVSAPGADLAGANLIAAHADEIVLRRANLRRARCYSASLIGAELEEADLREASFRDANLSYAVLLRSQIEAADFTGANLRGAILRHLVLREAYLDGANFHEADLSECDLEGIALEAARFFGAKLHGAWLTGSKLPAADFRQADLCAAGLADIHWEGADLRWADLRGCTFHMGSSRSGLVGSPYPGHGSKTGFYTDDYNDQGFKAPEEIRKANLCGADLRGALLDGVDFYLVDLRGAQFDENYAEHLTRCGAILYDRCA